MSEINEGREGGASARGAEWEVVSLTASAYAAAPGPVLEGADACKTNEEQPSQAMIMSGHFVFPPSEHENLPLQPRYDGDAADAAPTDDDAGKSEKEILAIGSLIAEPDDPRCDQILEGGKRIEAIDYGASSFCTFPSETTDASGSDLPEEARGAAGSDDPSNHSSGNPFEARWKRQVASIRARAKEASTFWSLCVAAAVMGLVILGKQWQQERYHFGFSDEKMSWFLSRASHLKDAIIGGRRCPHVIHASSSER